MKPQITIAGRSLIFNVFFVLLNLTGLTFLTIGSHENFAESGTWMKITGLILIVLSAIALFIFKGRLMISTVARVLVGGLFIISGLVKANDPIGFSYKLEEYFEDGALAYRIKELFGSPGFSLEFLIEFALLLSVIICIAEIVLGVLLIIGGKIKLVSYMIVAMMLFFTFLTWHTANCDGTAKFRDRDTYAMSDPVAQMKITEAETNKEIKIISQSSTELVVDEMKQPQCVSDCGCFGDAMKGSIGRSLSPHESFWKDIVVLYLCFWIFISQWIIVPNTRKENVVMTVASLVVVSFFSWVFTWYFPIIFAFVSIVCALWIRKSGGKLFGNYFGSTLIVTLLCGIFVFFVLRYEPMRDYRPYALGSNLVEKMNDGEEGVYINMLRYKNSKTKEEKLFDSNSKEYTSSKIWEDKDWKYIDMVQQVVKPTKIPSITGQFSPFISIAAMTDAERNFAPVQEMLTQNQVSEIRVKNLSNDEIYNVPMEEFLSEDYPVEYYTVLDTVKGVNPEFTEVTLRDYIVKAKQIVVMSAKNITEANWSSIARYKEIAAGCKKNNIPFLFMCNGSQEQIAAFRKKYNFDAPIFINDETELKAIARSNPSMMIIQKGIVVGKYPHRSTPTFDWLWKNVLKK